MLGALSRRSCCYGTSSSSSSIIRWPHHHSTNQGQPTMTMTIPAIRMLIRNSSRRTFLSAPVPSIRAPPRTSSTRCTAAEMTRSNNNNKASHIIYHYYYYNSQTRMSSYSTTAASNVFHHPQWCPPSMLIIRKYNSNSDSNSNSNSNSNSTETKHNNNNNNKRRKNSPRKFKSRSKTSKNKWDDKNQNQNQNVSATTYQSTKSSSIPFTSDKSMKKNNRDQNGGKKNKRISSFDRALNQFFEAKPSSPSPSPSTSPLSTNSPSKTTNNDNQKKIKKISPTSSQPQPLPITIKPSNTTNKQSTSHNSTQYHIFCSCLPGLEPYLYQELIHLGMTPLPPSSSLIPTTTKRETKRRNQKKKKISTPRNNNTNNSTTTTTLPSGYDYNGCGGVEFIASSIEQILSCHLHLGTASHVFLRVNVPTTSSDVENNDTDKDKDKDKDDNNNDGEDLYATGMEELSRKISKLSFWKEYINIQIDEASSQTEMYDMLPKLDIRVTSTKSRLYHTKGIAERVERGIWNSLGLDGEAILQQQQQQQQQHHRHNNTTTQGKETKDIDTNTIKLLVRVHKNQVQLSIDTSTTPLHRRGYRLDGGKAPLREDIAYALLYASGWGTTTTTTTASSKIAGNEDNTSTSTSTVGLLDPFVGSGTILIEGASMIYKLPPGRLRPPPMPCSNFTNRHQWEQLVNKNTPTITKDYNNNNNNNNLSDNDQTTTTILTILGSDRDEGVIQAAKRNANRAGVSDLIHFENCAISSNAWLNNDGVGGSGGAEDDKDSSIPSRPKNYLLLATNPPYGHRITKKNDDGGGGNYDSLLPLYQTLGTKVMTISNMGTAKDNDNHDDIVEEGVEECERDDSSSSNKNVTEVAILGQNPKLIRQTGIPLIHRFSTQHGGLSVSAFTSRSRS